MIRFFYCLAALALILTTSGCHAMNATTAERCVFVDLVARKGHDLTPVLDAFASELGLVTDKSHPINPTYARRSSTGEIEAEISYRVGMGRFGAELALFRFNSGRNADLVERFDRFVEKALASKYKVTLCRPEQYPTAYR